MKRKILKVLGVAAIAFVMACLVLFLFLYLLDKDSKEYVKQLEESSNTIENRYFVDGKELTEDEYNQYLADKEQQQELEEITKYNLNDIVSTDIIDFKLVNAEFSYYASSMNDNTYCKPVENTNGIFSTNKGHTFVCMTFIISNKDRASISIADYSDFPLYFDVIYNNEHFDIRAFDLNNADGRNYLSLQYALIGNNDKLVKSDTNNKILSAGETLIIQTLGQINTEPNNLADNFEMLIRLPNSKGETEEFIYTIE